MIDGGLRQLFRQRLPQFDWCSIESGATGSGIPDSNYCRSGAEGWLEFKQTPGHAVTLRPEQVGWVMRRVRHGGRVWIAVRQRREAGPRSDARDSLWLVPGRLAVLARQGGLRHPEVAASPRWTGGPSRWDWAAVAAALVTSA